ncbi:MAG: cupin domain-containing protein [Anaerolineales bacterium]
MIQHNESSTSVGPHRGGGTPLPGVPANEEIGVGHRLREIRATRKLSIRALAKLSGLNANTLSLIENGRTSPSVSTLQQLAQGLSVPITEFFQTGRGTSNVVFQKKDQRPQITFEHGTLQDLAAGMARSGAEPIIVTLQPGADSGKKPIVHTGREFVYCLEGQIAYTVDHQSYVLEAGDSLIFEAYLPHLWKNTEPTPSKALLVLCPLDDRDQSRERHFSPLIMERSARNS